MPTYVSNMVSYVEETRAVGAKPILVTPLCRRQWDKENPGKIKSTLTVYADEMKKIAAEKDVPLVDLHAHSKDLYEAWGKEKCLEFSPMKTADGTNSVDNTHLNAKGSVIFAGLVVEELRKAMPELSPCFRTEQATPTMH
jgi:lysophospholipase L1-like esterase